jgi:putative transposase
MPTLPKFDIPGHVHFITTNVHRNIPLFLANDLCRILLSNIDYYRGKHDFGLVGYVILPDHFHALIYPKREVPISRIIQDVKRYTAKQVLECLKDCPKTWAELGGTVVPINNLQLACTTSARRCLQRLHVPTLSDFQVVAPRTKGQEHQVWQASFYDFNLFSEGKLREKLNYIHANPLAWKLVNDPLDYAYSSFHYYYGGSDGEVPIQVDPL